MAIKLLKSQFSVGDKERPKYNRTLEVRPKGQLAHSCTPQVTSGGRRGRANLTPGERMQSIVPKGASEERRSKKGWANKKDGQKVVIF